jgi:hypothetical protein
MQTGGFIWGKFLVVGAVQYLKKWGLNKILSKETAYYLQFILQS